LAALLQSKQAFQGAGTEFTIQQIASLLPLIDSYTNPQKGQAQ
jgi:hypothetical protein